MKRKMKNAGGRGKELSPSVERADKNWMDKVREGVNVGANPKRGGMTNRLVDKLVFLKCGDLFGGVYSADDIPPSFSAKKNFIIIVNLGKKSTVEGHFVTLVGRPTYIKYIDSYGFPPFQSDVVTFLNACNRPVRHNKIQIQSVLSKKCGFFAILFACRAANKHGGKKLVFALGGSQSDLEKNDKLCVKYLRQLYGGGKK